MMLFLQQQGPANTLSYMILGYAVIFGVILIYLASLAIRSRNLRQDLEVLKDLEEKDK
jgi:TRAP-type C4-dicarboxylate transport system permease small subunit